MGTQRVEPKDILSLGDYEAQRPAIRKRAISAKGQRRIHLGDHLTFLFENVETLRYQVQEMLRIEKRSKQEDVRHEVATYNELLGDAGGLGCTLLIEIDDEADRREKLTRWLDLPRHLFLELEDGRQARARFDERQIGDDRLSAVQYLKFDCDGVPPVAIGSDLSGLELRAPLTPVQKKALAADLA